MLEGKSTSGFGIDELGGKGLGPSGVTQLRLHRLGGSLQPYKGLTAWHLRLMICFARPASSHAKSSRLLRDFLPCAGDTSTVTSPDARSRIRKNSRRIAALTRSHWTLVLL